MRIEFDSYDFLIMKSCMFVANIIFVFITTFGFNFDKFILLYLLYFIYTFFYINVIYILYIYLLF